MTGSRLCWFLFNANIQQGPKVYFNSPWQLLSVTSSYCLSENPIYRRNLSNRSPMLHHSCTSFDVGRDKPFLILAEPQNNRKCWIFPQSLPAEVLFQTTCLLMLGDQCFLRECSLKTHLPDRSRRDILDFYRRRNMKKSWTVWDPRQWASQSRWPVQKGAVWSAWSRSICTGGRIPLVFMNGFIPSVSTLPSIQDSFAPGVLAWTTSSRKSVPFDGTQIEIGTAQQRGQEHGVG